MANKEQIGKKDEEINALQLKLQELRKKFDQTGDKRKDEEIQKLRLELKHLKETHQDMKDAFEKEKKLSEKTFNDLVKDHLTMSNKLQLEVSDKDNRELLLLKKIKNLNYTVTLYKEQIEKFNKKSR